VTDWEVNAVGYLHVHFNQSLNSYKLDWQYCLRNHRTCRKLSISLHYMLEISASSDHQDLRCLRTEMTHQVNIVNHAVHWTYDWRRSRLRQTFRAYDVTSYIHVWRFLRQLLPVVFVAIQCTGKYCVVGTICHFKSPETVMLTYIIREVGTFCIVFKVFLQAHAYGFLLKLIHVWPTQSKKLVATFFETRVYI